jgi:lipoprotein-anchoring transpeptidase ErfK/SrfK
MTNEASTIQKKLRLGIEAARAGKKNIAQVHLTAVLQLDPQNVPAMLWLAFVVPSPRESIHWLERVLALDPNNERAQSGLRWARGRSGSDLVEPTPDGAKQTPVETQPQPVAPAEMQTEPAAPPETQPQADTAAEIQPQPDTPAEVQTQSETPADEEALRKKLLADEDQKETAKKGALAHRARRTIDPIATLLIVLGTLILMALGLGALVFVPSDTLAAWLPVSRPASGPISGKASPVIVAAPPSVVEASSPGVNSFASESDTLGAVAGPQLIEAEAIAPGLPVLSSESAEESSTEAPLSLPLVETNITTIEPPTLIGPELPVAEPEFLEAVDNSLLAHQPAYPGEKWIEVNVTAQQVTAWEGDVPVFTFTGSTGLPNTPTVLGEFRIYWKLKSTLMTGPGYYLPDVPYTMYFYKGYSLHGTYWHNNFGQPMSHGCVNLETGDAQKLFEWADPVVPSGQTQVTATADNPGTLVVVHQ